MEASTATDYPNSASSNSQKFSRAEDVPASTLPEFISWLMVRVHLISPELAAYHASQMDERELLRRLRQYAGAELSASGRNTQSAADFYQVFGFATATARLAALNPVPELPTERREQESSARAGGKNLVRWPGRSLPRLLPELELKNLESRSGKTLSPSGKDLGVGFFT